MATMLGGLYDSDIDQAHSLAQFAVDQHNHKENALLELVRVVKSQEQTVAGKLHHLTLEVNDAGQKKLYEAKIWVKLWMNFKELQEFKHIEDIPSSAFSEHDAKKDEELAEWRSVSVQDPVVQDAAHHAIKMIQQRSNSLLPYVLSEILHANTQVVDSLSKFDMLLKLKRGDKEEKFKVEVHQSDGGNFLLSKMNAHHP